MKRLTNLLGVIGLGAVGLALFIILLPVMIICTAFNYYTDRRRDKEFKKYLKVLGEKNFFCYNNRTDAKDFIEKELIPKLDKRIELIYLDGHEPKSSYVRDHISLRFIN